MFELVYTSAPHGLLPGRSGFSTVAMTSGMPPNLIFPLENLSGYNFTFNEGTLPEELNPVCCYYIKMRFGNHNLPVAGRVAPCGLDYSKRNNKIAHHILFESVSELAALNGGSAELFTRQELFMTEFSGEPRTLPFRSVKSTSFSPNILPAVFWQKIAGSSMYAGIIAERFRENPQRPFYIKYPRTFANSDIVHLIMEAAALLEPQERLDFTFSTYFTSDSAAVECFLRWIPDFSPLLPNLQRFHSADLLDLDNLPPIPEKYAAGKLCEYAVTGNIPQKAIDLPDTVILLNNNDDDSIELSDDMLDPNGNAAKLTGLKSHITVKKHQNKGPVRVKKNSAGKYRTSFLLAASAVVLFCAISIVICFIPERSLKSEPQRSTPPQAIQRNIAKKQLTQDEPATQVKTPQKVDLPDKKTTVKPFASQGKIVVPDPQTAAVPTVPRPLPAAESFQLFLNYRKMQNPANGSIILQLPEKLHDSEKIDLDIARIGNNRIEKSDFVQQLSPRQTAIRSAVKGKLPLMPCKGEISAVPHLLAELAANSRQMQFKCVNNMPSAIMPAPAMISRIHFISKKYHYVWLNEFQKDYLRLIPRGRVTVAADGTLSYTASALENELQNCLQRKFGNCSDATFRSSSFFFDQWNKTVSNRRDLTVRIGEIKKQLKNIPQKSTSALSRKQAANIEKNILAMKDKKFENHYNAVSEYIRRYYNHTPAERNDAGVEMLESFLKEFKDKLDDKIENQDQYNILMAKINGWKNKDLKKISALQKLKQELSRNSKKFDETNRQLARCWQNMSLTANNIDPSLSGRLALIMGCKDGKLPPDSPIILNEKHLKKLSVEISKFIQLIPITDQPAGKYYE